jgi:hypothetical protein
MRYYLVADINIIVTDCSSILDMNILISFHRFVKTNVSTVSDLSVQLSRATIRVKLQKSIFSSFEKVMPFQALNEVSILWIDVTSAHGGSGMERVHFEHPLSLLHSHLPHYDMIFTIANIISSSENMVTIIVHPIPDLFRVLQKMMKHFRLPWP